MSNKAINFAPGGARQPKRSLASVAGYGGIVTRL
jgi:hypothetical protein